MSEIQQASKTELSNRVRAMSARLKSLRVQGQRVTQMATHSALTIGGGAAAAVVRKQMPLIPGTQISTDLGAGVALVLLGAMDVGGDYSDEMVAFGSGMLAVCAADEVTKALNSKK